MSPELPFRRTALITGANRGIGLAVVGRLVEKSYRVFLASRDLHQGEAAARPFGLLATPVQRYQQSGGTRGSPARASGR